LRLGEIVAKRITVISDRNCSLSMVLTAMDQKQQKP